MSWASYEWKEGLPLKALQKIEELERHRDQLRKELQQRQFQIDSIEQLMTKQRQKFELEKAAHSTLSTDNKMLMDTCNQLEAKQHRTEHELQMKDARIQHLTDSLAQSKKALDSEAQKISTLERQLEKFEKVVDLMEAKERRSEVEMKKVKDQHWHDVAQIATERDTTGQLKVELMRARNHHMMSSCGLTRDRSNSGDHSSTSESDTIRELKHEDSSEIRELRERVSKLTAELGDKIQECRDAVAERNSFEEKYKSGLHLHKEQVDEYLANLTQLRTEHQQMLEQCAPSMFLLQKLDVDQLPLPPLQQMRNKRPRVGHCSSEHEVKKSKSQIPTATSVTKKPASVRTQAVDRGQTLAKGNTQHQDVPSLLQKDYDQSCDRIAQLLNQLDEATCRCELEKKRNAAEKKKLEDQVKEQQELMSLQQCDFDQACENDVKLKRRTAAGKRKLMLQIKELKGDVAILKAILADAATDREKQEMKVCGKRKNLVADNRTLSSKLQAMTTSHGRLQAELVQMTSRWRSLEQQVKSKVGMLTMFGEKLQRAEGVATSLERKLETKKANIEDTEGLLEDLTNKYDALKAAYEAVCKQLDDRNQGNQLGDTRCEDSRSHGLPTGGGKGQWFPRA